MKTTLFVNHFMPDGMIKIIAQGYNRVIKIKENKNLPKPVALHPDMQILAIGENLIMTESLYKALPFSYENVVFAKNEHTDVYPGDVGLNACLVGDYLIAREDTIDPALKEACIKEGITIIPTRQGYAKCSTLAIATRGIISADTTIVSAAKEHGIDALLISSGHIRLDGYDCGFIGGASFYNENNDTVYFFGDIKYHPDCDRICEFISAHGAKIVCCADGVLYDYGCAVAI